MDVERAAKRREQYGDGGKNKTDQVLLKGEFKQKLDKALRLKNAARYMQKREIVHEWERRRESEEAQKEETQSIRSVKAQNARELRLGSTKQAVIM